MTSVPSPEQEPGDAYWRLVDPIWREISIDDGPEVFAQQFHAAPIRNRNLLAAHWCQSEVCNGGFEQFFFNGTGVLAPEAELAFREIGMPRLADLVREAIDSFGISYPRERSARIEQLKSIDLAGLEKLDDRFFELIESEAGGWDVAADQYAISSNEPT